MAERPAFRSIFGTTLLPGVDSVLDVWAHMAVSERVAWPGADPIRVPGGGCMSHVDGLNRPLRSDA